MSHSTMVDSRGPRLGAAITSLVLAAVLILQSGWLLGFQAVVFGIGAAAGLRYAPYGLLFRRFVAPRLAPPTRRELEAAPRFAQAVGFVFSVIGVIAYASGADWLGTGAAAIVWVAAFLNAAFGFCIGCETYLLIRRTFSIRKGVTA
jgi:hypothetical protein